MVEVSVEGQLTKPMWHRLWLAQTVSSLGSQVTQFALPLLAATSLSATPMDMSLLNIAGNVPTLAMIPVGAWIDRTSRKRMLVMSDIGQALLLGLIPAAALLGVLNIPMLLVVCLLAGVFSMIARVAGPAFVASSAQKHELEHVNRTGATLESLSSVGGKALAGVLVALLTAPITIIFDCLTFLFSAIVTSTLPEQPRADVAQDAGRPLRGSIGEGIRFILKTRVIWVLTLYGGINNVFFAARESQRLLFMVRDLSMDSVAVALVSTASALGLVAGAALASAVRRQLGFVPSFVVGILVFNLGQVPLPFVAGSPLVVIAVLSLFQFASMAGTTLAWILAMTVRMAVTPNHLLGRVNATARFATWSPLLLGAALGGWLASAFDVRGALYVALVGSALSLVVLLLITPARYAQTTGAP